MKLYFSTDFHLLIKNESDQLDAITYLNHTFYLPKLGPRPPYFAYPSKSVHYPII